MTLLSSLFSDFSGSIKLIFLLVLNTLFLSCDSNPAGQTGQTSICKWQGNKKAAVSITYDDGIMTQFTVARPIMNRLGLSGTFFILTGKVEGAAKGRFIGRPEQDIINETASIRTTEANFFERASLIGFTGTSEALDYHSNAGVLYESGKVIEAYQLMDEAYEKLRKGTLKNTDEVVYHNNPEDTISWNDLRAYAAEGHEIASHTITHPRLAVMDSVNLLYELEQSRLDIEKNMGAKYTFSVECPYGTEDERVMHFAHGIYPALRNRMPADYLEELNRSSKLDPGASQKEYVQWQRGPLTDTSMDLMNSWIDTSLDHDNIWLVLVFHGVEGLGWESKTTEELEAYFSYIKDREEHLWVGTFADVTKYIRQRQNMKVKTQVDGDAIVLNLKSELDPDIYDVPVTFKTYIPKGWKLVTLSRNGKEMINELEIGKDASGAYVLYDLVAASGEYVISGTY